MSDVNKIKLSLAADDVVSMLQEQLALLRGKTPESWTGNDIKNLETLNKVVSVCMERKTDDKPSKYTKMTDEELEDGF